MPNFDMKIKYKKALVTGGAGFIGSHIVERLVEMGVETVVIDDLSMGRRENVSNKARLVVGDILSQDDISKAMRGVDIVFHNAAKVSIRNSFKDVDSDAKINIIGTLNVLKAMAKNKAKKIVYASSMAVYGKNPLPIKEAGMLEPISPYGIGKLASEKYCMLMGRANNFDAVILRYFNTYGPRQTFTPYVGVITIFIKQLLENRSPVIFGDGKQTRDFIYVKDVAKANISAMLKDTGSYILNVGTGKGTTVRDLAGLLIKKINPDIKVKFGKPVAGEPADSVADTKKADMILGFISKYKLEDKLEETIDKISLETKRGKRC